jgi:hypothetical protein
VAAITFFFSSGLLDDVSLNKRHCMSFQHDGAPPHYSREVRQWLPDNYPRRWIGRGRKASVSRPALSPDLNNLVFCLWGYLQTKIYASTVDTREGLWYRIQQFSSETKNTTEILGISVTQS